MVVTSSAEGSATTAEMKTTDENDNNNNNVSSSSSSPWSISVKTVGGGFEDLDEDLATAAAAAAMEGDEHLSGKLKAAATMGSSGGGGEKHFSIVVSPEDGVAALHDRIEASTGLKASQQRLIYRGRLIGVNEGGGAAPSSASTSSTATASINEDTKIKDIAGLCDGQTIHLIKKRDTSGSSDEATPSEPSTAARNSNSNRRGTSGMDGSDSNGGGGGGSIGNGSLLAALFGLSSLADGSDEDGATTNTGATAIPATAAAAGSGSRQRWGFRNSRLRSRRPHYRLTEEDLEVPDPGSMEPVRQGLMTLHTLLPHMEAGEDQTACLETPLEANREWYRGQWIDLCDTVNQWLEATIVEIVHPHEILPPRAIYCNGAGDGHEEEKNATNVYNNNGHQTTTRARRRPPIVHQDPPISASDLEGRRRLLLEQCEEGDPQEEVGDLVGFKQRPNNENIQLLLVHYNGWPHRWDEWIRSDSERIRPFRTRTRHPSMSSTACPTTQAAFDEAPRTNMVRDGEEIHDRQVLLPELSRALNAVNDMVNQVVAQSLPTNVDANTNAPSPEDEPQGSNQCRQEMEDLPWVVPQQQQRRPASDSSQPVPLDGDDDDDDDDSSSLPELELPGSGGLTLSSYRAHRNAIESDIVDSRPAPSPLEQEPQYNRRQLQNLAALLDRLGRTLTDAAPHINALAASLPEEPVADPPAATTSQETVDLATEESNDIATTPEVDEGHHSSLGGLLSWVSRERRRQAAAMDEDPSTDYEDGTSGAATNIDPDHTDYFSGLVNTTRGEVRSGPRSSRASSNDDIAGLLGAYLAAASLGGSGGMGSDNDESENGGGGLGRLLRERAGEGGGNGAGIDIHIHAVVTAPGMGGIGGLGGLGLATLGATTGGGGGGGGIGGGGAFGGRNLFSNTRRSSTTTPTSILRPSRLPSSSYSNTTSSGIMDEEDTGLFSELYSENPAPVDPNGSPHPAVEGRRPPSSLALSRQSSSDDENDFLARITSGEGLSSRSLNSSATRRRRRRHSGGITGGRQSSSTRLGGGGLDHTPRRRSSGWGRFFRRGRPRATDDDSS